MRIIEARQAFTTEEWIDLLMQTIGFNPEMFGHRSKLLQLMRLIPFVERNYNLIELGPKGTGKSHIFSRVLSARDADLGWRGHGAEAVREQRERAHRPRRVLGCGCVRRVCRARQKRTDKALVDIMKNYMANKTFSRGIETLGAEASMVFVGNTKHNVPYMLKHSDLFEELPKSYHDSAFIDRLHAYIPGWEVDVIRGEMFSNGYGFVVDYIAEILQVHAERRSIPMPLPSDFTLVVGHLDARSRRRQQDLLGADEDPVPAWRGDRRRRSRRCCGSRSRVASASRTRSSGSTGRCRTCKFGYADVGGTWHDVATLEELEFPSSYRRSSTRQTRSGRPMTTQADA